MNPDNGLTRALAALLIAAAFLVVLVVASVQQQAAAELKAHNINQSYSVARNQVQQAAIAQKELQATKSKLATLHKAISTLEGQKDQLEGDLYGRMQDVAGIARTIARSKRCALLAEPPASNSSADPALWNTVQDCAQDGQVPPTVVSSLAELGAPNNNPTMIKRSMDRIDREIRRNNLEVQQDEADTKKAQESIDQAQAVTDALQDVVVLDDNGVISWITRLPPIVMQVVLCFVAGLFGALLLTLILAVYPQNDFQFATSDSYWKRIFLGGLIAVAIYVVIGSSVSMLGSSRALIEDANVMSYTAIGILAGMFSERVARYLSRRGDVFAGNPTSLGDVSMGKPQTAQDGSD